MNWVQRKIYLYNVTFGLYMLDWWERCLFNTLMLVLMWFVFNMLLSSVQHSSYKMIKLFQDLINYHSMEEDPLNKFRVRMDR